MSNTNAGGDMSVTTKEILAGLTRHTLTSLGSIILCFSILWAVLKPHAETFVRTAMSSEQTAIEAKVAVLEGKVGTLLEASRTQSRTQDRMEIDIGFIKEMQREQRDDIKQLLKGNGQR